MVHVICINGIKKEIAFIRHEDAQAFPADSFGNAAYELLCANVFHDMEIRYVDIFASNRYAALKVPGNPGSRMLGRNMEVPGGASSGGLCCSGLGLSE